MTFNIAIFAKSPDPGHVKTRLIPPLDPSTAATLYTAFFCDCIRKALLVVECPIVHYDTNPTLLRRALEESFEVTPVVEWRPQAHGDLGVRMAAVTTPCMIIGADYPTLPVDYLRQAAEQLEQVDVILGPAIDGGSYLIGLRSPCPSIFDTIPWGTPDVLTRMRERAGALSLTTRLLPPWYDVDTVDDFNRLRLELESLPADSPDDDCPFTRACLRSLLS